MTTICDNPGGGPLARDPAEVKSGALTGCHAGFRYVLVYLVALAGSLGFLVALSPTPSGDEPHYLLQGLSMVKDHDLALTNDYDSPERVGRVFPSGNLDTFAHAAEFESGGPLRSLHSPLLPTLIAPLLATGTSWFGVRVALGVLTTAAIPLLLWILDRLGAGRRSHHVAVVLVVAFTFPYICFFTQIYPEAVAALLVLLGVRACLERPGSWWRRGGIAAACLLPWLQVRYLPLAGGLVLAAIVRDVGPSVRHWRSRPQLALVARTSLATGAPLALSLMAVLAFNAWIYGVPSFSAAYRGFYRDVTAFDSGNLLHYSIGNLLSHDYGILKAAPAYLVSLVGLGVAIRRWRWRTAGWIAVVLAYYLPTSMVGLVGGHSPLGRYTVPVFVLLAVPAALLLERRAWLAPAAILAAGSVIVTVAAMIGPSHLLYPQEAATWQLRLAGYSSPLLLETRKPGLPNDATIEADDLSADIGRLRRLPEGSARTVSKATDGSGFFAFGPFLDLEPGSYTATFDIQVDEGLAQLDIATRGGKVVGAAQVRDSPRTKVQVPFVVEPDDYKFETRAYVGGLSTAALYGVEIRQQAPLTPHTQFPWGKASIWLAVLFVLAFGTAYRWRSSSRTSSYA